MIGKTIDGYRMVTELGSGPTGEVWFAERTEGEGRAAIKILRSDLCSHRDRLDAVLAEIRAVGELDHPGVADVRSVGEVDDATYIVVELIEGETLEERLDKKHRVGPRELVRIGVAVADAIGAAHTAGMYLHRGIKPQNVFLVGAGVKVTDFGVDLLLTDSEPTSNTVRYASPEVCRGDEAVDHRSDIYSLGALLYHLATGHPPFEGDDADALVVAHTTSTPVRARERLGTVPAWLDELLARAMAKEVEERFQSMEAMATALRESAAAMPSPPPPPPPSPMGKKAIAPKAPPPPAPRTTGGEPEKGDGDEPEITTAALSEEEAEAMASLPQETMESLPPDSAPPEAETEAKAGDDAGETKDEAKTDADAGETKDEAKTDADTGETKDEAKTDADTGETKDEAKTDADTGEAEAEAEGAAAEEAGAEEEQEPAPPDGAKPEKKDPQPRIFNSEPPPLEERQRRVVDKLSRAIVQRVVSGSLELPPAPEGVTAVARLVTQTSSEIDAAEILEPDEELRALVGDRWEGALFAAELARGLAMETGDEMDPRLAYMAPLVLEAGRPLVQRAVPAVETKLKEPDSKYVDDQVRAEVVELCHREVAVSLAYAWGLPPAIPQALPNAGTLTPDEPRSLQNVLTLAIALAAKAGKLSAEVGSGELAKHLERGRELLGVSEESCEKLIADASAD